MARTIIKQPNGKYAIFSTIVDCFILVDIEIEQYIQYRISEEAIQIREDISWIVEELEAGRKPYYQFTTTWEEAIEHIKEVHGEDTDTLKYLQENKLIE